MSVKLKTEPAKPDDLTEDQYAILQAQGNLPKGFPFRSDLVKDPSAPDLGVNTGSIAVLSTEQLEAEIERRKAAETQPSIGDKGGIEDDEEDEAYEDMSNDDLRAELASRDLAVSGTKDELIKRLEEDDESETD